MKIVSLNCVQCSAPLRVTVDTRLIQCSFCHTQLAVHHDDQGGNVYSEIIEDAPVDPPADDVGDDQLDAEFVGDARRSGFQTGNAAADTVDWPAEYEPEAPELTRQQQLEQLEEDRKRMTRPPTKPRVIGAAILVGVSGLCWIISSPIQFRTERMFLDPSPARAIVGVILMIAGFLAGRIGVDAFDKFASRETAYRRQREDLLQEIADAE